MTTKPKTEVSHTPQFSYRPDETTGLSNAKDGYGHLMVDGFSIAFNKKEILEPLVRAVNAYTKNQEMIKALLEAAKYCLDWYNGNGGGTVHQRIEKLEKAIAQAEAEGKGE